MATNVTTQGMFSIAAAHGITQRTVASWSEVIPRTPRVLVPIQVDALVVREQGGTWADCLMKNPPAGATTASRRDLLPSPFTNQPARVPGVYLHWALPDALTHATASVSTQPAPSASNQSAATSVADATFPAIPDRWLVVRYYSSGAITSRRAIQAWVLRAGDYPTDGSLPQPIPIDQWTETGPSAISRDDITAMGHGDAAWAAYYDNVQNRLGFYDALKDIQQGPISYLVCGWYSNSDRDPLGASQVKSLSDFYAKMAEFQWKLEDGELDVSQRHAWKFISAATQIGLKTREAVAIGAYGTSVQNAPTSNVAEARADIRMARKGLPARGAENSVQPSPLGDDGRPIGGTYVTNGSWWPELTLYHGSAVAIGWPGVGWEGMTRGVLSGEFGGPPPASDVNVMVGTTPTDALASLVAKVRDKPDEARLLEAFMLGALSEFDQADGPARTDALLQASAFYSRDGGTETEQIWVPAMPPTNPATPANPTAKDTGIFKSAVPGGGFHGGHLIHATPNFVERAATTNASATGRVYTLGAEHSKFSEVLNRGDLQSIISVIGGDFTAPQQTPGHYKTVQRALPRFFQPSDPVILIQGAARSFKHGKDGRYNSDGTLSCRLTGFYNTELSCQDPSGALIRYSVHGEDLLTRGLENGSVPPECDDLLKESVLHDPGSAAAAAQSSSWMSAGQRGLTPVATAGGPSTSVMAVARNYAVEQTAWWATRDPRVDHGPLLAYSGYKGTLPSPISVAMPRQPWTPMHLDWEVQYVPSNNGIADWSLDENDFVPDMTKLPSTDDIARSVTLKGRAHLTAGIADTVASSVRRALTQAALSAGSGSVIPGVIEKFYSAYAKQVVGHYRSLTLNLKVASTSGDSSGGDGSASQIDRSGLDDIASALENMDVLCGALDAFHQQLRGGYEGDGKSAPAQGQPAPNPFFPLRAGFLQIVRLRLVDCFGQVLDLAGSSDTANVDPQRIDSSIPMEMDGHPNLQMMPPRFTSPSRLWLRFADNSGATNADSTAVYANATVSPVCGFLLPNHLDGALEFFDNNGQNQGVLRPDEKAGIVWEDAPGIPSSVGQTPERAISNQFSAGIARGLLDWGTVDASLNGAREDALSALLRIVDSSLWSVDPFGHTGDEHLSLLIGHPVAVLRASVRLELQEPIALDAVNKIPLPLRIGALKHWQDGLFGYFINDDYRTFYCSDAAVAGFAREVGPGQGFLQQINAVDNYYQQFADDLGADVTAGNDSAAPPAEGRAPVDHPYINSDGFMVIRPNQEIKLTLLVEPHALVHGTTGLLPRKDIGLRRSWIATGLANISPTFRFGPVLVDPKTIKMPVAVESFGSWSWDHRTTITAWGEDKVVNATQDAILPADPVSGTEGWLRLVPTPPSQADTSGEAGQV